MIKNLLTTIFERYKTDMTSLHNLVEMTTGDLSRWVRGDMVNISIALSGGGMRSARDIIIWNNPTDDNGDRAKPLGF